MSVRVGSSGPSSCDRSALPVANQAGSGYKAAGKGKGTQTTPSIRRCNLNRELGSMSPEVVLPRAKTLQDEDEWETDGSNDDGVRAVRKGQEDRKRKNRDSPPTYKTGKKSPRRSPGKVLNQSYTSLTWDEGLGKSVHKASEGAGKEASSPSLKKSKQDLIGKIPKLISKLDKEVRLLRQIVKESRNTRSDIKDLVEKIASQTSQLNTAEIRGIIDANEAENRIIIVNDTEEKGTQTDPTPWQLRNHESTERIREDMGRWRGYEGYCKITQGTWQAGVFRKIVELEGNPLKDNSERDMALMMGNSEGGKLEGRLGIFMRRFPELFQLSDKKEGCICLTQEAGIMGSTEGKVRTTINRVYIDTEDKVTYMNLVKFRENVKILNTTRLAILFEGPDWEKTKKMMEHIFLEDEIRILVYKQPGGTSKKREPGEIWEGPKTQRMRRNDQVVIVKADGRKYAEILKNIKGKVNPNELGVELLGARATRNGDLLITMAQEEGAAEKLKKKIEGIYEEQPISVRTGTGRRKRIELKGLEATVTREEIETALREGFENKNDTCFVINIRPAYGGSQNATVEVSEGAARNLLAGKKIKIGWSLCRVTDSIVIRKCNRCWGFGHGQGSCKGMDRSKLCLKCAKDGHKVAECTETPFCPKCDVPGHRADSAACPISRKEIYHEKEKRERANLVEKGSKYKRLEDGREVRNDRNGTKEDIRGMEIEAGPPTPEVGTADNV